ncbi:hypothetical protein FACS1894122_03800 [Alphaproteobacteria bacterium]|nr:hypothetical protein FACS1894122_03800 [Alphaproteobacteria bacterium]
MKANKLIIACAAAIVATGVTDKAYGMNDEQQHGTSRTGAVSAVRHLRIKGGIYTGILNGKHEPHGLGIKVFRGGIQVGNFANGKPNGKGMMMFSDGIIYVGDYVDGLPHGKGKVLFSNRNALYAGDFVKGEWQGKGKLINSDGIYEGDFVKGEKHGMGKLVSSNGFSYEGKFVHDIPEDYLSTFSALMGTLGL